MTKTSDTAKIGKILNVKGFFTQYRYIQGRTLAELESILGYEQGRLEDGIMGGFLMKIPTPPEFELYGYSQVAGHKWDSPDHHSHHQRNSVDRNYLKKYLSNEVFTLTGPLSLVKVFPIIRHDSSKGNDEQYPPGSGVPQWSLTSELPIKITTVVKNYPNGVLDLNF